jgi:hypothetical protein
MRAQRRCVVVNLHMKLSACKLSGMCCPAAVENVNHGFACKRTFAVHAYLHQMLC